MPAPYLNQQEGDVRYARRGSLGGGGGTAGPPGPAGPAGPAGPPGASYTRVTATLAVTASLAPGASEQGVGALAPAFLLYRVSCSAPSRVRLYTTTAKRDADLSRPVGTDPTGDHGLILEWVATSGLLGADLSPMVDGFDGKATPDGVVAFTITNTGASAAAITVSGVWIRSE